MPKSMTGFGRGVCIRYDRRFQVEIKSVNHRYRDFTIKLPRFLNSFEDLIRKRLAKDISRGKVDVWINFESYTQRDLIVRVNEVFADAYMTALKELSARYNWGDTIPAETGLNLLARNTDVMSFDKFDTALNDAAIQEEIWETLSEALEQALAQFSSMREAEGAALFTDISEKKDRILRLCAEIAERVPAAVEEHAVKLRARITELMDNLSQSRGDAAPVIIEDGRFLTEVALLADRSCIDEELTRLGSHLSQMGTMLSEECAIGRKLDFLVQELNREANTIGSKSTDAELVKLVVELKSEIEKIREQVQNLE